MGKTQKILIVLVVGLILINVILMGFVWRGKIHRSKPMKPDRQRFRTERFFERKLDFDQEQVAAFRELEQRHNEKMDQLHQEVRLLNRDFHEAIIMNEEEQEQEISQQLDSMTALIKEESVLHIRELAQICEPEQKEQLLKALNELPDRRGNRGRRGRPGRHSDRRGDERR